MDDKDWHSMSPFVRAIEKQYRLTGTEAQLFAKINGFPGQSSYASYEYFATSVNRNIKHVRECLGRMVKLGILERRFELGGRRTFIVRNNLATLPGVPVGLSESTNQAKKPLLHSKEQFGDPTGDSGTIYKEQKETQGTEGETDMGNLGLIKQPSVEDKHSPSVDDIALATLLKKTTIRMWGQSGSFDKLAWAHDFRIFRQKLKMDPKDLRALVEWYCSLPEPRFIAHVHNAYGFRKRYEDIADAYKKAHDIKEYSPEVERLYKRHSWPKALKRDGILEMIDKTITNRAEYLERMKRRHASLVKDFKAATEPTQKDKFKRIADRYSLMYGPVADSEFVANWVKSAHASAVNSERPHIRGFEFHKGNSNFLRDITEHLSSQLGLKADEIVKAILGKAYSDENA